MPTTISNKKYEALKKGLREELLKDFAGFVPLTSKERRLALLKEKERTEDASRFIQAFIKTNPSHWGVCRQSRWWRMMIQVFSFEDALGFYLDQFPEGLTQGEYQALERYLGKKVGLDPADVTEKMKRFSIRSLKSGRPRETSRREFRHALG